MYIIHHDTKIDITYVNLYRALLKMNYEFRGQSISLPDGKIMYSLYHIPTKKTVRLVLESGTQ